MQVQGEAEFADGHPDGRCKYSGSYGDKSFEYDVCLVGGKINGWYIVKEKEKEEVKIVWLESYMNDKRHGAQLYWDEENIFLCDFREGERMYEKKLDKSAYAPWK